jgi:hypothetical protein
MDLCPAIPLSPLELPSFSSLNLAKVPQVLLRFLLEVSLEESTRFIHECFSREDVHKIFAVFVFSTPSFFKLANQLFPEIHQLRDLFRLLSNFDQNMLINYFVLDIKEIPPLIFAVFGQEIAIDQIVAFSEHNDVLFPSLVYLLLLIKKFDGLCQISSREADVCAVLREIYRTQREFYMELLAKTNCDLVVLAIATSVLLTDSLPEPMLSLLMNHDSYLGFLFDNAQDLLIKLINRERPTLIELSSVIQPESIASALFKASDSTFLSISSEHQLGRAIRFLIEETFPQIDHPSTKIPI